MLHQQRPQFLLLVCLPLLAVVSIAKTCSVDAQENRCHVRRLAFRHGVCAVRSRSEVVCLAPSVASNTKLIEMRVERLSLDGSWTPVPDDEVVGWDEDVIRYSPVLQPDRSHRVATVRLIKRPWADDKQPWTIVAESKRGELYTSGKLEPGHWAVSMEVEFDDRSILRLHE